MQDLVYPVNRERERIFYRWSISLLPHSSRREEELERWIEQAVMFLRDKKKKILLVLTVCVVISPFYLYSDEISNWLEEYFQAPCDLACMEREFDENETPGYLVHTPTCTIPDIPVNHPSVAKFKLEKPAEVKCSKQEALTEESGLKLLFYPWKIKQYGFSSESSVNCFYQGIIRVEQDPKKFDNDCDRGRKIKEERVQIKEEVTLIEEDAVFVTCFPADDKTKDKDYAFYKNVHYFIQPRRGEEKQKKHQEEIRTRTVKRRPLSVILMGTDSVSRANLIRHMPKTFDYLTNTLRAIDLRGLNKIGDNTYPNLVPMLSGLTDKELGKRCLPRIDYKYDDCPFIWKNYSERGYITSFGEDSPWMGIFHYHKTGFAKQPTDYYNVPPFFVSDDNIGHYGGTFALNGRMCQGGKLSLSVIHDYSLGLVRTFKDTPTFGLYWAGSLTHDDVGRASVADQPSLEYLQRLHHGGYLEDTVLFFLSDHGMRFGNIRATYAGMLEERLPYMLIVLPRWFKEEYPEAFRNLKINTRRLTAHFDIYSTLQDILNQAYADLSKSYTGAQYGQSLFKEVPENRTCEDLAITPHYCTCQNTEAADLSDPQLLESANFTVLKLNHDLRPFSGCVQLRLDKVMSGRVSSPNKGTNPKKSFTAVKNYLVVFNTTPGGALMESSVQYSNKRYSLIGEVSRINAYGNQSHCIEDDTFRKYCFCKDMLR